jgi:hypothetical protein
VCDFLGATELVDHNPDAAFDAEESKAQRRRACWTELTFRGLDKWVLESDKWYPEDHGFEPVQAPVAVPHAPAAVAQPANAEGAAPATFSVNVKDLNGRIIKVSGLKARDTVKLLKLKIAHMSSFPFDQQLIVFNNRSWLDSVHL